MSETRKPFETYAHYKIGKGFATLAVSVDDGVARVGVSYCHPRDGIDKSFGRAVAIRRRDADSTFSFDFKRTDGVRLSDQLRDEFEQFIVDAGTQRAKIRALIDNGILSVSDDIRVGAPPWIIHSLNREIRKRDSLEKLLDANEPLSCAFESNEVPFSSACHCC